MSITWAGIIGVIAFIIVFLNSSEDSKESKAAREKEKLRLDADNVRKRNEKLFKR
ncbi:MAG: hypothetical protein LWW88_02865 [Acinetobacter sp.]|uniref:hypothetical protein n=1 Tax=Acinetobacter sp. TaxID=472 RepID=UPI0025830719|nr:hypothetical protein [Acinetobacter sp.]MCE1270498.1 hypothetical protein [Acinetobacter sp.]